MKALATDSWRLGEQEFHSRLLLGTSRYPSRQVLLDSLAASRCELVTVSLRRVELPENDGVGEENLYAQLKSQGYRLLPNTAGCFTARDAVLTAQLAREALQTDLIKVEVIADEETLLPEVSGLLEACRQLVKEGFVVLPYTNDDPIIAQRLADLGCAAVMPLAAPIGSGLGIRNPHNLELIRQLVQLPLIVDAGLGTASDVVQAFELGYEAVLLNTAVARARNPVTMAEAMHHAVCAGRAAALAGRIPKQRHAAASSPLSGRIKTHG